MTIRARLLALFSLSLCSMITLGQEATDDEGAIKIISAEQDRQAQTDSAGLLGTCWAGQLEGDVCAEGICNGCGVEGTRTVYRCDADLQCNYSGEENCFGTDCPIDATANLEAILNAGEAHFFPDSAARTFSPLFEAAGAAINQEDGIASSRVEIALDKPGDIIIDNELNVVLASKGKFSITEEYMSREGYRSTCLEGRGKEVSKVPCTKYRNVKKSITYDTVLSVQPNSISYVVNDIDYGVPVLTVVPLQEYFSAFRFKNCTTAIQSGSENLQTQEKIHRAVQVKRGVTTTTATQMGGKMEFKFGGFGGGISGSKTWTKQVAFSSGTTETETDTVVRTRTVNFKVPQESELLGRWGVRKGTAMVPFVASLLFEGSVRENNDGVSQISELLSADERTFTVTGFGMLQDLSEIEISFEQEACTP